MNQCQVKFIYSEKATQFCEIFTILLTVCTAVKSKAKISQNIVAFSAYMNFTFYYCVSHPLRIFSSYAFPTSYLQCRCRVQRSFNRQDGRSKHLVGPVLIIGHFLNSYKKKVLLLSELKFDGHFDIPSSVGPTQIRSSSYMKFASVIITYRNSLKEENVSLRNLPQFPKSPQPLIHSTQWISKISHQIMF